MNDNSDAYTSILTILLLIVCCFVFFLPKFVFGNIIKTTSNGSQYGEIVSIDQTKAYVLFGDRVDVYIKSDAENSESIKYCLRPDQKDLIEQAKEYSRNNSRVEVAYESYYISAWNACTWQIIDITELED